ncbi:hypothetical protein AB0B54_30575 [Microbispora bryophytorum]|uniref:hypothetical protein n=1 Tax=Microbispora bryophytorum TaxID=1460882 RepID=UPI0033DB5398
MLPPGPPPRHLDGQPKRHGDFSRRPVTVEQGATIGAGAVLAPGVAVCCFAIVAIGAVVHRDVACR